MIAEIEIAGRPPRLFTRDDYHAMADSGILKSDEQVELINGRIVTMFPMGSWHVSRTARLVSVLSKVYGDQALVMAGVSICLADHSEPQPDVLVAKAKTDFYESALPAAEDILLLVEISDSSRVFDLGTKLDLYAAHGISEYWVVDQKMRCIHVFRSPANGSYQTRISCSGDEWIELPQAAGKQVRASEAGA